MSNDNVIGNMFNDETTNLFSDIGSVIYLHHTEIKPNPLNWFPIADVEEMKASIQESGIAESLVAYEDPHEDGMYILISGERRWTAANELELDEIPVHIIKAPESVAKEEWLIGLYNGGREEDTEHMIKHYSRIWDKFEPHERPEGRKRDWIARNLTRKISGRQVDNYLSGKVGQETKEKKPQEKDYLKIINNSIKKLLIHVDQYEKEKPLKDILEFREESEIESLKQNVNELQGLLNYLKLILDENEAIRSKFK